jgi:phosphoglycolate phosphatase
MFDSIIFDLDGTLWDAVDNILISWNEVIKNHSEITKPITKAELTTCMGLKMDDIAAKLFPDTDKTTQLQLMEECSSFELEYLAKHGANLFEATLETIKTLSKDYKLFICSNCQSGYIECFLQYFKLNDYFTDIECWGNTGLSKGENNKLLIERNSLKAPVYVGDTQGDFNSAVFADIPFIFASYGFGSCPDSSYRINGISELPAVLKAI